MKKNLTLLILAITCIATIPAAEFEVGMGIPREAVHLAGDPEAPRSRVGAGDLRVVREPEEGLEGPRRRGGVSSGALQGRGADKGLAVIREGDRRRELLRPLGGGDELDAAIISTERQLATEISTPSSMALMLAQASTSPIASPTASSSNDSMMIWPRIMPGFMPSAIISPISRTRSKTAMTSVLTRPNDSARKMTTTHTSTKPSMTRSIVPR